MRFSDMLNLKKFHFVGIGGAGMSVLAKILIEMGYEVSGSDCADSANVQMLKKLGAKIFVGHNAQNISNDIDAVVYSSAIPKDNPELVKAAELNILKLHRSDINAMLVNSKKGIAVAGSHGKTTTTSMIGYVLKNSGVDPTIIIGGESLDLGTGAILGAGEYLVSEADESDGSFVKLTPNIAVVTNVEDDHLDHYGTVEKIRAAFKEFLGNLTDGGTAVLCFDSEPLRKMAGELNHKVISYAIDNDADFMAKNIYANVDGVSFDVFNGEKLLGRIKLAVHGRHNVLNALGTLATALYIGIPFHKISNALSGFHGAKRRFQTKANISGVWIVDDYGHHPTEIAATLKAARETNPRRVICVFQPHRYSRTKLLLKEFGAAFTNADLLVLTDIYSAGEEKIDGISGESILKEVLPNNKEVSYIPQRERIVDYLLDNVRAGDLVITMGAGDIYKTGEELIEKIDQLRHKNKIVVVMGGTSTEAEVSRRTGTAIFNALKSKNYNVETMELNPKTFAADILKTNCAIVFNAVHGLYGEDGLIQGTLDMLNIPYTGSDVLAAAITMDKVTTKKMFAFANVTTPRFEVYRISDKNETLAARIEKNFGVPVVIKAANQGSSIGVEIVEKAEDIFAAVENSFKYGDEILVEEFIKGRELTVAVFGNEDEAQALPIIEITTTTGRYDYETKYKKGASTHICPAEISAELTKKVQSLAVSAFKVCKCAGVARVDIMLSEENIPYAIEVNSVPGMTETSLVPDAARAAGIEFPELCEKILASAGF